MKVKRSMRVIATTVLAGALVMGAGLAPTYAESAIPEGTINTIDVEGLKSEMLKYGLSSATQDLLVAKLEAGESWDSMSGAEPVRVEETRVGITDTTVSHYADGSIRASSLEKPKVGEAIGSDQRGVSGCTSKTANSVTSYTNCKASETNLIISAEFRVSYSRHTTGGSWITATGSYGITILSLGAGYADVALGITKATASSGSPAVATLSFRPTGATFGTTCRLEFRVTTAGATSVHAWF